MHKNRLFVILAFMFLNCTAEAQTVKFGVKAGINFASVSAYDNPTNSTYQNKSYGNFRFGGIAEINWHKLAIQTELILDGKGGIDTYINPENSTNRRKNTRLCYLETPIVFLYKIPTKTGTLLFGGGPYAAYGISGKYSLSGIVFDSAIDGSNQVVFGNNENSDYKRTDYGLNLRAEIRLLHGIGFGINYEYGLRNIATPSVYDDIDIKTRNKVLGIAVSYLFNNH
ncbi:porin family protein [Mucilaginibacter sp.]|uniref:porin family protein n=1 Tax=Mucilaginibacter sp. TaxID=1882438 RepID=UPI003AFFD58B